MMVMITVLLLIFTAGPCSKCFASTFSFHPHHNHAVDYYSHFKVESTEISGGQVNFLIRAVSKWQNLNLKLALKHYKIHRNSYSHNRILFIYYFILNFYIECHRSMSFL